MGRQFKQRDERPLAERIADADALVITDVQTQRRQAERRSIFINGEFAMGVSEEMYVKYALYKGRVVTLSFLEEVQREDEIYRCKQTAMNYQTRRMRSRREMEEKLAEKGFPLEAIDATIRFLIEYRMMDDRDFARAYINDQIMKRPVGRRRLENDLRRKGLQKDEVAEIVSESLGESDELAHAMAAAEKKARTIRHDDPQKWERAMAAFLAGRGFDWSVVGKILERYRRERREPDNTFIDE
ncbi:MAG: regulatory protein RecX [Chlorobi bacterium]|nr:regulatory protein RecX [Chlorobiota bacterium]